MLSHKLGEKEVVLASGSEYLQQAVSVKHYSWIVHRNNLLFSIRCTKVFATEFVKRLLVECAIVP